MVARLIILFGAREPRQRSFAVQEKAPNQWELIASTVVVLCPRRPARPTEKKSRLAAPAVPTPATGRPRMIRSVGNLSFRLSHLQEIHADLLEKVSALASLRKQVQQKEAALHAKIAARKQWKKPTRAGDTSPVKL